MYRLQYVARFWNDDSGISPVKFAILLAFLSVVFFTAAEFLRNTPLTDGREV